MTTIEVTCECGRTYVLPAEKEGRKLQCRRCGAVRTIRRDADPGVVVPFHAPDGVGHTPSGHHSPKPPTPSKSRIKTTALRKTPSRTRVHHAKKPPPQALRRCPACGFQDDPGIVICVRCNYDYRTGEKPEDSEEIRIKAETHRAEVEGEENAARVETYARLGFIPFVGVFFGLLAVGSSGGSSRRVLRDLPTPARRGFESRIDAARLLALATILLWSGIAGWFLFIYRPSAQRDLREGLAERCRANLEEVGKRIRLVRRQNELHRFPADPKRTVRQGIDDLVAAGELDRTILLCPQIGSDAYAGDAALPGIDEATNPQHLILWDAEAHLDPKGAPTWRALRADGQVEDFRGSGTLEKAKERPPQGFHAPVAKLPDRPPPPKGNDPEPLPPGFEQQRAAILKLAKELDERDPGLAAKLTLEDFRKSVGLAAQDAVGVVTRRDEDEVKRALARLVARLDVPAAEAARLAAAFEHETDPEARLAIVNGLKRAGSPAWLEAAAALAQEGQGTASEQALALVAAEARTGKDGLRRVLLRARALREKSKAAADQPIFALPPETYPDATELLDDADASAEALALLSRGTPEVERALDSLFSRGGPQQRELAFRALRASLAWRGAALTPYHEKLKGEQDRAVKAAALLALADGADLEAVRRALEALRDGQSADVLAHVARKVLSGARGKDCVLEIVNELDAPGTGRDEALRELMRGARIFDDLVSEVIAARAPYFERPGSHEVAVELCALRYDEAAHRFLILESHAAVLGKVREQALRAVLDVAPRMTERARTEAATELPARLAKETDASVRAQLIAVLEKWEFRSPAGLLALDQVARRGAEPAATRERAVAAIAAFNEPRAVTMLSDLVDGLKDSARWRATSELRKITDSSTQPVTTAEWKRIVHQSENEVRKRLREREDKEAEAFAVRARAAAEKRAELQARIGGS